MQRLLLQVTDRNHKKYGKVHRFSVRGNGILFEQFIHEEEMSDKKMDEMNENFRNSLRYVRNFGGWPSPGQDSAEAILKALNSNWSSSDTGLAVRCIDDPVKAFLPFKL